MSTQISLREMGSVLVRRRRVFAALVGVCLLLSLLYWLIMPNQYEARAKVLVHGTPSAPFAADGSSVYTENSATVSALQQETLANVLRSERLGWKVIVALKLYEEPGFAGSFAKRYAGFKIESPSKAAQAYLLKRFLTRLDVQSLPRTMLVEIRFRSRDAELSSRVVERLLRGYLEQESEARVTGSGQTRLWLEDQLEKIKQHLDQEQQRLADFQRAHGILNSSEGTAEHGVVEAQHSPVFLEVDELGRQLVAATSERILREAEYRSAAQGDPELVLAGNPRLQSETGNLPTAQLHQIAVKRSELEQEMARLKTEHGPNFPRVVEIDSQLRDLERQRENEDKKLLEHFRATWQTAQEREAMVRKSLDERTAAGMQLNQQAAAAAAMRQEIESSRSLYLRIRSKADETALTAGVLLPGLSVIDPPRAPDKPVSPHLLLDLGIALFAGLWLGWGGVFLLESIGVEAKWSLMVLVSLMLATTVHAQAPTPSTSGLPTGVARIPLSRETKTVPNAKEAPPVWGGNAADPVAMPARTSTSDLPLPAPIGPGDFVEITEFRTPEFHSQAHVSPQGGVTLPLIGEIKLDGLDETAAARAIESALIAKGMLLHPHVSVLVTAYAGQDVSVLGEVARPGVYPFTAHHRLLDLISAASGLTATAGRLVNIFHRDDSQMVHPVVLDPGGTDVSVDHNPELLPGDTVQVSRAGLVYVVGDVVRPGGFSVDPSQGLTVAQALSLAWGPTQNANTHKAILIREQKGGRTLTSLNLKRILHGQDPDQPVYDRDILYVPDSSAKNLINRTLESAIQSLVGVSIYSGLVYSQRY